MQQEEAAAVGARPVPEVQAFDRLGGNTEKMGIAIEDLPVRVDAVRQESESEIAAGAGEMVDLQPFDLLQKVGVAGQEGRHGDKRS